MNPALSLSFQPCVQVWDVCFEFWTVSFNHQIVPEEKQYYSSDPGQLSNIDDETWKDKNRKTEATFHLKRGWTIQPTNGDQVNFIKLMKEKPAVTRGVNMCRLRLLASEESELFSVEWLFLLLPETVLQTYYFFLFHVNTTIIALSHRSARETMYR